MGSSGVYWRGRVWRVAGGSMNDAWREKIDRELQDFYGTEVSVLERATSAFKTAEGKLLRPDGTRLYADDEHKQRVEALLVDFDKEAGWVTEKAERHSTDY